MTTVDTQQTGPAPSICILIPAYNAEHQVAAVVRGARQTGLPVIVVDDGSSDQTRQQAQQAGALVLRHHANRGKGAALQTGFAYARAQGAEAVLTLDADGQHDTAEIPKLIASWQSDPSSLVMGVRSFDPALMPRRSRIGNHISTFFISLFAGRPHSDTQTGFRIYPRRLISLPLSTRRFDTETELLLWASKLAIPLREVPVQTIYRVPSTTTTDDVSAAEGTTTEPTTSAPRTHFRNWEDTLRVLGLVVSSPWWRRHIPHSNPDDLRSHARST